MRYFPSAPWLRRALDRLPVWAHPQWLVTAVAAVVAVAGLAVPLANADDRDDLQNEQNQVKGQISSVKGDIHEASQKVAKIARRLDKAKGELKSARSRLAAVRADLATAREAAATLATKLADAEAALVVAKAELEQARADVALQREVSRDTIIEIATGADPQLALMTAYADGRSLSDVLLSRTAHDLVIGRQQSTLTALVVAEGEMEERRKEVRGARDEVATAKKAADDNVATVARLVESAASTEASIASLVGKRSSARKAVIKAREADRAALRRLERREARIRSQILALSQQQGGNYNGDTGGLLARPATGPVTSPYGYRIHPIYGYYGLHNGTDFSAPCGSSLYAGESGTVIRTYYDEVYGNRLYLAIGKVNGASITLVYNHLTSYRARQGDKVRRGEVVGYAGNTGWSTGCHLHFTVLRNGQTVDPMNYL